MKETIIIKYCLMTQILLILIIYNVIQFSYIHNSISEDLTSITNTYHIFNFLSCLILAFAFYVLVAAIYDIIMGVFQKILVWRGVI